MNYQEINFRDMSIEEIYNTIQILKKTEKKVSEKELEFLYKEARELNNNTISNFAYFLNKNIEKKYEKIIIKLNNETLLRLKKYSDIFIKLYQKTKEDKYKEYYIEIAFILENYLKKNKKRSFEENVNFINNYSKEILKYDTIVALQINTEEFI